jgi:hypothetical protein
VVLVSGSICILVGMLPLAAGYIQSNLAPVAAGCLMVGLVWLLSQWRGWVWVASLGIFVFITAAGMGVWIGLSPILMAFSVLGSLMAWDLAGFSQRLRGAAPEDNLRRLEKEHLLRSASLGGAGLVLILLALFIHVRISFGWMILLALAGVMGLVQLVNRLRRGG